MLSGYQGTGTTIDNTLVIAAPWIHKTSYKNVFFYFITEDAEIVCISQLRLCLCLLHLSFQEKQVWTLNCHVCINSFDPKNIWTQPSLI